MIPKVFFTFPDVNAFVGVTIFIWCMSHLGINLFILKSTQPCRIIPYYPFSVIVELSWFKFEQIA